MKIMKYLKHFYDILVCSDTKIFIFLSVTLNTKFDFKLT